MSDNGAVMDGYSRELMIGGAGYDLHVSVKSDVDLDDRFKAWDHDEQEFIYINGWLIEYVEDVQ